jgi:hypothetical protein
MTALSDAPARESAAVPRGSHPLSRPARFGLAFAVVGGLFFYFYTRSDMWLDEALSVNIARVPFSDLVDALKHDGAPPLYYVLLHLWTGVFGTSDEAVRALSGVCMLGAVVATWFAARRIGGTALAWIAAVVMLSNPYAIRYATEARMYALIVLLVACGVLAFQRMVESPTAGRAAVFGLIIALALYTQYWSFYLLAVVVVLLVWMVWRDVHRTAARRMLIAAGIALVTFLPWAPTFLYQAKHTGTPWGTPILPSIPFAYTLRDFAGGASGTQADRQEGWLLFFVLLPMLLLGIFARGEDSRHIEIDVRTQKRARGLAFVGGAGLVVALTLSYLAGSAFQSRYSSIVFPFFVLLVALGFVTLRDPRILGLVLVVAVALGFAGGIRNVATQRTQAGAVAAVLRAHAKPGDLVVYCPDQVGPSVHRLAPKGLREVVFPSFAGPERIDWVDYKKRIKAANLQTFAKEALARAGAHNLWYVSAPGYTTHTGLCEEIGSLFGAARPRLQRTLTNDKIFEKPALEQFPAQPPSG